MSNHQIVFREIDRDKFEEIVRGIKTIETRAATAKYTVVKPGDSLTFLCGIDTCIKMVSTVEVFPSIDALFEVLPLRRVLPGANTVDDAKRVYLGFPNYEQKIQTNGIVAFSLTDSDSVLG